MTSINIVYVRMSSLKVPLYVVQIADLISQSDCEGRVVVYRDTLNDFVNDWEEWNAGNGEENDWNDVDMKLLRDLISDNDSFNENNEHVGADWYVFE